MSDRSNRKPLALAIGTAMTLSLAASPAVAEPVNPFGLTELASGYMVGAMDDPPAQRDQEGSCGEEGNCGEEEGNCGEDEGNCGEEEEGNCGEEEGNCGEEEDKDEEGSCGEGRCGGA